MEVKQCVLNNIEQREAKINKNLLRIESLKAEIEADREIIKSLRNNSNVDAFVRYEFSWDGRSSINRITVFGITCKGSRIEYSRIEDSDPIRCITEVRKLCDEMKQPLPVDLYRAYQIKGFHKKVCNAYEKISDDISKMKDKDIIFLINRRDPILSS